MLCGDWLLRNRLAVNLRRVSLFFNNAPSPLPGSLRSTRRGRFIFGRVLLVLIVLAAVTILAPFIYSIWMLMHASFGFAPPG